jgi:hypothetical protein
MNIHARMKELDDQFNDGAMTATKEGAELQQVPKTGLGHQLKKDQKAFEAARQLFRDGMLALTGVEGSDALDIRIKAAKLMDRCEGLSYSANEKYSQND